MRVLNNICFCPSSVHWQTNIRILARSESAPEDVYVFCNVLLRTALNAYNVHICFSHRRNDTQASGRGECRIHDASTSTVVEAVDVANNTQNWRYEKPLLSAAHHILKRPFMQNTFQIHNPTKTCGPHSNRSPRESIGIIRKHQ